MPKAYARESIHRAPLVSYSGVLTPTLPARPPPPSPPPLSAARRRRAPRAAAFGTRRWPGGLLRPPRAAWRRARPAPAATAVSTGQLRSWRPWIRMPGMPASRPASRSTAPSSSQAPWAKYHEQMRTNARSAGIRAMAERLRCAPGSSDSTASSRRTSRVAARSRTASRGAPSAARTRRPDRRRARPPGRRRESAPTPPEEARRAAIEPVDLGAPTRGDRDQHDLGDPLRVALRVREPSVEPHDPPVTSQRSMPRCSRSRSMSPIRCSVVLTLISVVGLTRMRRAAPAAALIEEPAR